MAFWLAGLAGIVVFAHWEAIPFHLIWIGFALFYGFRIRRTSATAWILAAMIATTFAAIGLDVWHRVQPAGELAEVPLMAALLWVMMWHAHRTMAADAERAAVSEENARLLETQRVFLQDASHQLRTPITIALGHAELLARDLADRAGERDIHVVVGELTRLKSLAERLLLIAASENPDFLRLGPIALDGFIMDVLRRWRPTADRLWRLGRLDPITVIADRERLGLAIDALLENAIQHTGPGAVIRLSVLRIEHSAHMIIEDTGEGIPRGELARIFDRFTTSPSPAGHRGTGLGLPLVRAIARGHGGEVWVRSSPGEGSRFEFMLPVTAPSADGLVHLPMAAQAGDPSGFRQP